MKTNLRKFLSSPGTSRKQCRTCARPELARDVAEFLDARKAGNHHTWHEFYREHVRARWPDGPAETSVRRHVEQCLRRDATTGESLP